MSLTADEVERGWVSHECDTHGFLVATTPRAVVTCRCGKVARILRNGRIVTEQGRVTQAKARSVNASGHPNLYACGDCGADFGGTTLLARHRVGGVKNKRCLSSHEMIGRGWFEDGNGRWRERGSLSPSAQSTSTIFEAVGAIFSPSGPDPVENPSAPVREPESVDLQHDSEHDSVSPPPWSNPTRNWKRAAPGSRGGQAGRGSRTSELRSGFVYFFQGDTTRRIKIGFSDNPERRLEEIRSGASERMRLLGSVFGTTTDEASLHRKHSASWVHNEWFAPELLPDVATVLDADVESLESIPFV